MHLVNRFRHKTLTLIAADLHLATKGTKEELIHRIQTTMADQFEPFTTPRLLEFAAVLGVQPPASNDRQELLDLLHQTGISPSTAMALLTGPTPPVPVTPANTQDRIQLAKQGQQETADDFLERVTTHLALTQLPNDQAIAAIINAANPTMAHFVTTTFAAGTTTKDDILAALKTRFGTTPFQAWQQYRSLRMAPTQTAWEVANQLRRWYTRFMDLPQDQLTAAEAIITKEVLGQLITLLPPTVAAATRALLLQNPGATWEDTLNHIDALLIGQRARTPPQPPQGLNNPSVSTNPFRRPHSMGHCSIHGPGHSDSQCRVQRNQNTQGSSSYPPRPGNANTGSG